MNVNIDKKIYLYSNLPSGGASKIFNLVKENLVGYEIVNVKGLKVKPKNIFDYLLKSIFWNTLNDYRLAKSINKSDILICFQSWLVNSPPILRFVKTNKIIFICHEPLREYYDNYLLSNKSIKERAIDILKYPIKIIDKLSISRKSIIIIANSNFSKNLIKKIYKKKSLVICPGIDLNIYSNIKYLADNRRNQVISMGAINKLKRYEFIIEVIANIPKNFRPNLVLIGNGGNASYIRNLRTLALNCGVKLKIYLNANLPDIKRELSKSKIFIYAPINEPYGLVVIEAMASGLPLFIYKNGGGYSEVVGGNNGVIMNNLDPNSWAKELEKVLDSNIKLMKYSKNNIKLSRKYSGKKYIDKLNEEIKKL